MVYPVGDPQELARRLSLPVPPDPALEARLTTCLRVAAAQLDPRCDEAKVTLYPDTYSEALYQFGIKVWDTGTRGTAGMDIMGGFDLSPSATSGLFRSVLGVAQPVLKHGGVIVG